jgi:GNAT superfamily N-acetyltransferase
MIMARPVAHADAAPAEIDRADPPAFDVVVERGPLGATVAVLAAGQSVCAARLVHRARPGVFRWLHVRELVIDRFGAHDRLLLRDESAGGLPLLRALLRRSTTDRSLPWHVAIIVAEATDTAVIGAGWRLAAELELECEIGWIGTSQLAVSIHGPGLASQLARAVSRVPDSGRLTRAMGRFAERLPRRRREPARGGLYSLDVQSVSGEFRTVNGVSFREVDLSHVALRPLLYADSVQAAEEPLARGDRCFVGDEGGRVVYRMWVGAPEARWLHGVPTAIRSAPSWYVHDCHTARDARRRGIYVAALHWLADRARVAGVRFLHLHVAAGNLPAIRAVERAGFVFMDQQHSGAPDADGPPGGDDQRSEAGPRFPEVDPSDRQGPMRLRGIAGSEGERGLVLSRPGVLELVREVVSRGGTIRVRAGGSSMWPTIADRALVEVGPLSDDLRTGQIVLADWEGNAVLHRIVEVDGASVTTCGDACVDSDPAIPRERVIARAIAVESAAGMTTLTGSARLGAVSWVRFARARARLAMARVWRGWRRRLAGHGTDSRRMVSR